MGGLSVEYCMCEQFSMTRRKPWNPASWKLPVCGSIPRMPEACERVAGGNVVFRDH
jgi:hypothetical protein